MPGKDPAVPWQIINNNSQILAIHAALLPTNQILMFGGDEHNAAQNQSGNPADVDNTRLFNLSPSAPQQIETLGSPNTDVFCSGHSLLADGRLLVGGGTQAWGGSPDGHAHDLDFIGERACWIYSPRARTWRRVRDLSPQPGLNTGGGRWYPTLVTLGNGEVIAVSGHPSASDTRHHNDTQERYATGSDSWTQLTAELFDPGTGGPSNRLYPRFHLLPDGTLFFSTPYNGNCRRWNPFTGTTVGAALPAAGGGRYNNSWDFPSILLPLLPQESYRARVLVCGDLDARRIDLGAGSPVWNNTSARQGAAAGRQRRFACAVILPTGDVFVSGGINGGAADSNAVREGEIYSPGIDWNTGQYAGPDSWQSTDAATVARNYHSTALLMPDGRVWTAGSSKNANAGDPTAVGEMRIEVFRPSYDGDPNRPMLSNVPASAGYGQTFNVSCPQAAQIRRAALTRCGSVTHAFDADQRYVGLTFDQAGEGALAVTMPPNSNIAPPGYYLLWVIDASGRPCQEARFIRLCPQGIELILDRSTFSTHEVTALGVPATFPNALYVILNNYLPSEAGQPLVAPALTFALPDGNVVPGMTAQLNNTLYEDPSVPPDVAQRITFVYNLRFSSLQPFNDIPVTPGITNILVRAQHGGNTSQSTIVLSRNPNPYMRDGSVHWLSTDLRVFNIQPGQVRATITMGNGANAPTTFIQNLTNHFNGTPTDEDHPWFGIAAEGDSAQMELATMVGGQPIYNFAVARVRFRAPMGINADDVRVFFRTFTTASTGFVYNAPAYPRTGDGTNAAPLLGLSGGEILSIPFYAEARQNDMRNQVDASNRKQLVGQGAQEVSVYFGCWLDFNQTTPRFPLAPPHNGNGGAFSGTLLSLQQLMRNHHLCLVAEVHYINDLIPAGATPGSHENLAQRNLVVVESDNPGNAAAHTVQSTFEIKPSAVSLQLPPAFGFGDNPKLAAVAGAANQRLRPDELLIRWNNLPADSRVSIYAPDIDVNLVAAVAGVQTGVAKLRARESELLCAVGGATYVPIPGGRQTEIPALITIEMPPTVTAGERYTLTVHQISGGFLRRIIGTFQITILVRMPAQILPAASRRLAVFKHIGLSIPAGNRWRPIWNRLLKQQEDNVRGLGGNPDAIPPSPHGYDGPDRPGGQPPQPCPGDDKHRADLTGRVGRLFYDCYGQLEGLELHMCGRNVALAACGRGIERVLLQACRHDLLVNIWLDDNSRPHLVAQEDYHQSGHAHNAGPAHAEVGNDDPKTELLRGKRIRRIALACIC